MSRIGAFALALILLFAVPLFPASHSGLIRFNGLPVPGATATAIQGNPKFTAATDLRGIYTFPDLPAGTWTIRIEMPGFQPLSKEITTGPEASSLEWELTMLPPGEMKTEPMKSVSAEGLAVFQQAEADDSAGKTEAKTPAAQPPSPPSQESPFANLTQDQLTERAADGFLINGSTNNGAASPFAQLAAFGNNRKLFRSLYNAAFGLVLNNSALNARSFSLTGQDTPKPDYNRMQLSFNIGGPLRIPHLLKRGPNFYFGYQRNQDRDAMIRTSRMPTQAEREGDLSQALNPLGQTISIFDPGTGLPFKDNKIPEDRISPQAQALLSLYPLPNYSGGNRYNYQIPVISTTHQDSVQGQLTQWGNKGTLTGTFNYQNLRGDNPNVFAFLDTTRVSSLNAGITFNQYSMLRRAGFTLRYQFGRTKRRTNPYFAGHANISGQAGIYGNNQDPDNWGPPSLAFSNYERLSDGQSSFDREMTNSLSGSYQFSRGKHNLTSGFEFRRLQFNLLSQQDARGAFTFTGAAAGYDFADFLLGIPDTSSIAFGNADKYLRGSTYAAYVTDDWRIMDGFTLNVGVRWEYEAPITELYGRLVNLDITSGFRAAAPVLASNPTGSLTKDSYASSLVNPDKMGIEPRVGFAWRPSPASSLVIRGGYGLYRDTSVYRQIANQMAQQPPFSKTANVGNGPGTRLTLANGFDVSSPNLSNTFAIDPNFRVASAHNWQLSIQRDLPFALQAVVMYQGAKGSNLIRRSLPNTFPDGAAVIAVALPSGFVYQSSDGSSIRHAGQIQLRRRLRNGLTANARYTYSKSIDNAGVTGSGTSAIAQNWLDLDAERAISNFDQRHLFNLQTQYTTGARVFGPGLMSGWRGAFVREWTFSGQLTIGSGMPLTPTYPAAVQGTGFTGSIRPDYTGAPVNSAPAGLHLNPASYAAPAKGEWGNAGRNSITGPGQFSLDASLARTFRMRDRMTMDFSLESKNILNHVTYPTWNTTVNSLQFGLPDRANPMRTVQANVRVRF